MKKVGESANPLQKIGKGGQSRKGKEKESEVSTGSSEKMKAPAPATRTTPATIASGSASGKAIQPPKPPGSGAPKKAAATTSAMEEDNPFGPGLLSGTSTDTAIPVERFTTPPPRDLPDPVTPRSEAGKRMALDEDIWVPTTLQVGKYLRNWKICAACWKKGHTAQNCPSYGSFSRIDTDRVLRHPGFRPYLNEWQEGLRKKGNPKVLPQWDLIDAGEVVVKVYCSHCQSGEHNTWDCPDKPMSD